MNPPPQNGFSSPPISLRIFETIRKALRGKSDAVMLFGSYARGDFKKTSDIDVLQVTEDNRRPYKAGKVNVSPYNFKSLQYLARHGSLFILHLKTDGRIFQDDKGLLEEVLENYVHPKSYAHLKSELRQAAQLLDCPVAFYETKWPQLHNTYTFIFRSWCFALCAESGIPRFSMAEVSSALKDERITEVYELKRLRSADRKFYLHCLAVLGEYLGAPVRNSCSSFETLLLNQGRSSKLLRILGQRIIESGSEEEFYGGQTHTVEDLVCPLP